jgi:hypothetical protein
MSALALARLPLTQQARVAESRQLSPWTGLLVHAVLTAVVAASLFLQNPSFTLALGGCSVFPTYLWLCWREGRRTPLCVSPLSFMFLWNSVGLGLSAIYIARQASAGEYLSFSIIELPPSDVAQGYVIYLVGIAAMHAGMELLRPVQRETPYGGDLPFHRPLHTIAIGFAAGLVYLFRQDWFAFLGAVASPLSRMATVAVCLLALLPHWYLGIKRHIHWILLAITTFLLVIANLKSGSKAYIMFAFFPLVWAMIARKELRRNLIYAGLALILVYTGLVAPTIAETRIRERGEKRTDYQVLWNAAQDASPLFSGKWELDFYGKEFEKYLNRMFDPTPAAFLVQEIELRGFQYGETMKYALYAFIPRILWPEKPNVSRGAWFTAYLGFSPREEESTTSTGITAVGELYWNFGVPGVLIGMFFIGALFGVLWKMAGINPVQTPLRLLLYVYVTLGMPDLPEAVTLVASSVCLIILFGSLFFVLRNWTRLTAQQSIHLSARAKLGGI